MRKKKKERVHCLICLATLSKNLTKNRDSNRISTVFKECEFFSACGYAVENHQGFRVASENLDTPTATVGVWIDAGSRYEDASNNGVAHFLEHMAFKGTSRRKQSDLEIEVENMGAHLNAYTSREQTVYYAKCFAQDLERAVEMLSDILLNSVYGENEIWRERQVIIREAEEVAQNMQEVVFDHLHAGAYAGCSLSRTILGTDENIRRMHREQLIDYIGKYYKGPRMLLAAAGGVDHSHLVELAKKYFGKIEHGDEHVLDYEPGVFTESHQLIEDKQMEMVYGSLAVEGTSWTSEDNIPVQVVNTLIGQFDRTHCRNSSRLARTLSPNSGVSSFMSYTTSYKDTGLTGLFFCAEPDALFNLAESVCKEWRQLCEEVDVDELERAKRSLLTNSLLMLDGSTPICEDIGRQLLCFDRRISTEELEEKINSITPDTIRSIGRRYFVNKPFAYVIIGKTSNWPNPRKIQKWLSC
ncbi:hypothetical protein niasHT_030300 [Heterodera trifolii]|uniref:Mitochondrial processing peptidase n=1 Tax=Heterodera trifolii TaxID=157864 RepID=A0ABD2KN63_9BILA